MICRLVCSWSRMKCSGRTLRWWLESLMVVSFSPLSCQKCCMWEDELTTLSREIKSVWKPFLFFVSLIVCEKENKDGCSGEPSVFSVISRVGLLCFSFFRHTCITKKPGDSYAAQIPKSSHVLLSGLGAIPVTFRQSADGTSLVALGALPTLSTQN